MRVKRQRTDEWASYRPNAVPARHAGARVGAFSLVMAAGAAALYLTQVRSLAALPMPVHIPWWGLAAGFAVATALVVNIHYRRDVHSLSISEIPLVLGLLFGGPGGLILGRLVGSAVAMVAFRRQRPLKLWFNLAQLALEATLAVAVFRLALGDSAPLSMRGWGAVFAGVLAGDAVSHAAVTVVIRLTTGGLERDVLGKVALVAGASAAVMTSFSLVAAIVISYRPQDSWLLLAVVSIIWLGLRTDARLRQRYGRLEALYDFTRSVSGSLEAQTAVAVVLARASQLLRAGRAELTVGTGGSMAMRASLDQSGEMTTTVVPLAATSLEHQVMASGRPVLIPRRTRDAEMSSRLDEHQARDLMVAPLADEAAVTGTLMVCDRLDAVSTFDGDDLKLFATLAAHASVALRNERLVMRLRQEAVEKEHRARHDALTGLANRILFQERVTEALAAADGEAVAVLLIDLDRFKEVNDTLGHHNGDLLLKESAARLCEVVHSRGTVARLGGDEFGVTTSGLSGAEGALGLAEEVRTALEEPFALEGLHLEATASVGVALSPHHGRDAATLLQRADVAMYAAKAAHLGSALYRFEDDHYTPRRLTLVGELRRAIEQEEISLHYQPVALMEDVRVVGVEALARWAHPRHGFLPPDEFIPIAEHTGLIRPLTYFVLDAALRQAARWQSQGLGLGVSVNLSVRSLLDNELVERVASILHESQVPPSALTLEITESSVMADIEGTMGTLSQLSNLGIRLAVDDFGTGYSSLAYLQKLPVEEVKIDKSFIMHMSTDSNDAVIVRSTIELARNLGLRVVAEGVEDRLTWARLRALGCQRGQGYALSRPLPPGRLEDWLKTFGGELAPGRPMPKVTPRGELRALPASSGGKGHSES